MKRGKLHLVCGKIAAGKSTLCGELAAEPGTVTISQDKWLSLLYPDEMKTVEDFIACSARLRGPMGEHVVDLLRAGLSVVLDFPANTINLRAWMKGIAEAAGAEHVLHYLDLPDEVCRERLRRRNAEGGHEYAASDEDYDAIASYFQAPGEEEGLNLVMYPAG
jgi:predicted kinase